MSNSSPRYSEASGRALTDPNEPSPPHWDFKFWLAGCSGPFRTVDFVPYSF